MATLADVLASVGLNPGRSRDFFKLWCPFHPNPSGKTLWVSQATGLWGCLSTRCSQHNGGVSQPLPRLLMMRGMHPEVARSTIKGLELVRPEAMARGETLRDRDFAGVITEAHIMAWSVDWELAATVCEAVQDSQGVGYDPHLPVSSWCPGCEARPGEVEHDCWEWLWYLLVTRGLDPAALSMMDVGFDRERGLLVFPLRGPDGRVRGVARRECRDGADYLLEGCVWRQNEPEYRYNHVERSDTFFGWSDMSARIMAGQPVVVVEGYVDQLRLAAFGYCAVAKMSNRMTRLQRDLLVGAKGPIILWPDHDRAGLEGAQEEAVHLVCNPAVRLVTRFGGVKDAGSLAMTEAVAADCVASAKAPAIWLSHLTNLVASIRR